MLTELMSTPTAIPEAWSLSLIDYTNLVRLTHPWFLPLAFALIGACLGSFLNVVIYRLPRGIQLGKPARSFCPTCGARIPWYLNLPIVGWLLLRGRSACCHRPISPRYLIVELLTAGLFAAVSLSFSDMLTLSLVALWAAVMIAVFFIDLETMTVMRRLTLTATSAALLAAATDPWLLRNPLTQGPTGLLYALISALIGYLLFKLIALLGMLLFGMRRKDYATPVTWSLSQSTDGEDIELNIHGERLLLSTLLNDIGDRVLLRSACLRLSGAPAQEGLLELRADTLVLPDGTRIDLEAHERLTGSCRGYALRRSAMGSGDAWIAMAIGALIGWDGIVMALTLGSLLGLIAAIASRHGFGRPMPFGPFLITAAMLWWFFGDKLLLLQG